MAMLADDYVVIGWLEAIASAHACLLFPDIYTHHHHMLTMSLARGIGAKLNRSPDVVTVLEVAARIHDIGKAGVIVELHENRFKILESNSAELIKIRTHAELGERFILTMSARIGFQNLLIPIATAIRSHHEWYSGGSYPDGKRGNAIPWMARVIAVLDSLAAMTDPGRPHRPALSLMAAREEIKRCSGTQFDPLIVTALESILTDPPPAVAIILETLIEA